MSRRQRNTGAWWNCVVCIALGLTSGCAACQTESIGPLPTPTVSAAVEITPASAPSPVSLPAGPLTLEQLLGLAYAQHPELAAAHARIEAARGRWIQAGLYPNPTVGWEADQLGDKGNGAGEQGPFVEQRLVTGGKLRLAQAAAAQGIAVADWQALTSYYEVVNRVRIAYYDVLLARREVQVNEELARIAEEAVEVAKKLLAATGSRIDQLRAQIELDRTRFQLAAARQRERSAWQMLATAVGVPSLLPRAVEGTLDSPPPDYDLQAVLRTMLTRSSEIQESQAEVLKAQQELQRAFAEIVPDLQLKLRPFYAFPDEDGRLLVEAGVTLPLFNRNQGNIVAAQAEIARTAARVRQVELRLIERLTAADQRYQIARRQAETYKNEIMDKAEESLRAVRLSWEKNDPKFDYNSVLLAQRTLVEARLAYVQALGELWRAASEIAALLQEPAPKAPAVAPTSTDPPAAPNKPE